MAFKKSSLDVSTNKNIWTGNLTQFNDSVRTRSNQFKRTSQSLENLCKMPKEAVVVGRYLCLGEIEKSRSRRVDMICEEVSKLWRKLDFPMLSRQTVLRKVHSIMQKYDRFLKRPIADIENSFENLFDITKPDGEWLCSEDKEFYQNQVESKGRIGYATMKLAAPTTIHPSKRRKVAQPSTSTNSNTARAIFALLSYILVPESREQLDAVCSFICGKWCDIWFSRQLFNNADFENLKHEVEKYPKAALSLKTHWSTIQSPLNIPRSNICAERAINVSHDLYPLCRSEIKLNLRFLLSNSREQNMNNS
jgi:hypothetical protein